MKKISVLLVSCSLLAGIMSGCGTSNKVEEAKVGEILNELKTAKSFNVVSSNNIPNRLSDAGFDISTIFSANAYENTLSYVGENDNGVETTISEQDGYANSADGVFHYHFNSTGDELFKHPLHPYTKSLLSAIPKPNPLTEKNRVRIVYDPRKEHDYSVERPKMVEIVPGHFILANTPEIEKYKKEIALLDSKK